jgi:putative resolvase
MGTLTITEAAELLRRGVKTLQRWDRDGVLKARRTKTNRRFYTLDQVNAFLGIPPAEKKEPRRNVAYLRVSSQAQRPDLGNQRHVLAEYCRSKGLGEVEYVEEIKGGLNFKRPKFASIMDAVEKNQIATLIVAHKDRLCRFGFEWFNRHCERHGCRLVVLDKSRASPEQEMVQDLMTIVHCFSSRLYGLRNYRKALVEALKRK